jgi:hypothetical protein
VTAVAHEIPAPSVFPSREELRALSYGELQVTIERCRREALACGGKAVARFVRSWLPEFVQSMHAANHEPDAPIQGKAAARNPLPAGERALRVEAARSVAPRSSVVSRSQTRGKHRS